MGFLDSLGAYGVHGVWGSKVFWGLEPRAFGALGFMGLPSSLGIRVLLKETGERVFSLKKSSRLNA